MGYLSKKLERKLAANLDMAENYFINQLSKDMDPDEVSELFDYFVESYFANFNLKQEIRRRAAVVGLTRQEKVEEIFENMKLEILDELQDDYFKNKNRFPNRELWSDSNVAEIIAQFIILKEDKKKRTYAGRKSPSVSATEYPVGQQALGNDDKYWIVKADKNGRHRWVKRSAPKKIAIPAVGRITKHSKPFTPVGYLVHKGYKVDIPENLLGDHTKERNQWIKKAKAAINKKVQSQEKAEGEKLVKQVKQKAQTSKKVAIKSKQQASKAAKAEEQGKIAEAKKLSAAATKNAQKATKLAGETQKVSKKAAKKLPKGSKTKAIQAAKPAAKAKEVAKRSKSKAATVKRKCKKGHVYRAGRCRKPCARGRRVKGSEFCRRGPALKNMREHCAERGLIYLPRMGRRCLQPCKNNKPRYRSGRCRPGRPKKTNLLEF